MLSAHTSRPRVALGMIYITPGAENLLDLCRVHPMQLLARHASGDWGDMDQQDKDANDQALLTHNQVMSCYQLAKGKCYVVTEPGGHVTTIYLPSEH